MPLGRLSNTAVAIPSLLIACAFALCADSNARAEDPSALCQDEAGLALLSSPIAPWSGAPLRVVFTVEKPADGELALIAPDGKVAAKSDQRLGGPPYFWFAEIASPAAGNWQAKLTRVNASRQCREVTRDIAVQRKPSAKLRAAKGVWPLRDTWTRETENLYSAWIEKLFDAPLDEELSWKSMDKVLHDPSRNILFNHLGLREDEKGRDHPTRLRGCSYVLRAYFAFKMGLPFGYSKCTRGDGGIAPKCTQWWNVVNEEPPPWLSAAGAGLWSSKPASSACFLPRPPPNLSRSSIVAAPRRPKGRAGVPLLFEYDHRRRRAFRQWADGG